MLLSSSSEDTPKEAYNPLRTFTTYGCAGAGVDTIAIERVRDHFYDVKYWNNNSKYGEYEAKSYYCLMLLSSSSEDTPRICSLAAAVLSTVIR